MKNKGGRRNKAEKAAAIHTDDDFEQGDADASDTIPQQCSSLRKGGFVCMKEHPCKIVEMSTSAPGKHGHAKVHLIGLDIFTGKKYEDVCPASHNMAVPNVKRQEFQLVNIGFDGYLTLMDDNGALRSDIKNPDGELGDNIKDKFKKDEELMINVISSLGDEKVIAMKSIKQP